MMSWKVCTSSEYVSFDQLKTVLEMYDMENHQKISMPDYQKLKNDGEEKHRTETSIKTGALVTSRKRSSGVERGQVFCYQWKRAVFETRQVYFPARRG